MSIEELLQQMEDYRARRGQQDHRPDWLRHFIKKAAALFEPLTTVGRVGYDCQADERGWNVCLYLGTTEIIGGPKDGQIEHAGFVIDLKQLMTIFQNVQRFEWYSISNKNDDRFEEPIRSVMKITGQTEDGHFVQLELLASPPRFVGPGLRQQHNDNSLTIN
ncbi:MAG: hypothetical protein R3C59_11395 [Planctomycetaceae bacterium]